MDPTVSVVCVTHKKGELLRNSLRAVLAQFGPEDELVVVDDGGFDHAVIQDCRAFAVGRPVRYLTVPHRGYRLATLCNVGVLRASNQIVIKVDGDVVPMDGWLAALRSTIRPSVLVAGRIEWRDAEGGIARDRRFDYSTGRGPKGYLRVYGGNMGFVRSDFLALGGFSDAYDGVWGAEDADLGAKFALRGKRVQFAFDAAVVHQWHPLSPHRAGVARNRKLLEHRCRNYRAGRTGIPLNPTKVVPAADAEVGRVLEDDLVLFDGNDAPVADLIDAAAALLRSETTVDGVVISPADVRALSVTAPRGQVDKELPWLAWDERSELRADDVALLRAGVVGPRVPTTAPPSRDLLGRAPRIVRIIPGPIEQSEREGPACGPT